MPKRIYSNEDMTSALMADITEEEIGGNWKRRKVGSPGDDSKEYFHTEHTPDSVSEGNCVQVSTTIGDAEDNLPVPSPVTDFDKFIAGENVAFFRNLPNILSVEDILPDRRPNNIDSDIETAANVCNTTKYGDGGKGAGQDLENVGIPESNEDKSLFGDIGIASAEVADAIQKEQANCNRFEERNKNVEDETNGNCGMCQFNTVAVARLYAEMENRTELPSISLPHENDRTALGVAADDSDNFPIVDPIIPFRVEEEGLQPDSMSEVEQGRESSASTGLENSYGSGKSLTGRNRGKKCRTCHTPLKTVANFRRHEALAHIYVEGKSRKCPTCQVWFSNHQCLGAHIRLTHTETSAPCSGVRKTRGRKNIPPGTFQCKRDGCTRGFTTNGNLKRHISTTHDGLQIYQCDECGLRFSTKSNRDVHRALMHH